VSPLLWRTVRTSKHTLLQELERSDTLKGKLPANTAILERANLVEERSCGRIEPDNADRRSPWIEHATGIANHEVGKSTAYEIRIRKHSGIELVSHFVVTVTRGAKYISTPVALISDRQRLWSQSDAEGVMGDPASPWGLIVGHNGGGPCYSASAFHAFGLDGLSVCAMGAIERGFSAERIVAGVFDYWSGLDTDKSSVLQCLRISGEKPTHDHKPRIGSARGRQDKSSGSL
jgi:hypothetical protein